MLDHPVSSWGGFSAYKDRLVTVRSFIEVSDAAQKAIKVSADFGSLDQTENIYQDLLMVVDEDRKLRPNQRCSGYFLQDI